MFQKIPVEIPKPLGHKGKRRSLLHAIGDDWHMKKLDEKIPLLKKQKISKTLQEN